MMQFFRSIAKPLILVTAIAFFIWLVVDLSGLSGGGGLLTRTSVGKVNGTTVDLRTFQASVQQATQDRQSRTGGSLGLEEQAEVRDQVWEQTIQEIIFRAEYDRYGIRASDEEIAAAIKSAPPQDLVSDPFFQTDGKFDPEKYQAWLGSAQGQQFVPMLEARYREQILRAKLFQRVISDVTVSDPALWERFKDQKETVRVGVLTLDPRLAVGDSVRVTGDEVERYYKDHKDEFDRKAGAFVSYISMPRLPNSADTAAARARAVALHDEIAGGTAFAEVAKRESSDTGSGRNGGDLGEIERSRVDSAFGAAAMSLPLGKLSDPVLSQFGFHLIEVKTRKGDSSFTARHILIPIEVTGAHRDLLDKQADSLEKLGAERLERSALDTAARALRLRIATAGPLVEGRIVSLPEPGSVPDVSVWAFQATPGEHSPVIESERSFVLFRLDSVQKGGIPPLATVRSEVEDRVRLGKKLELARGLGERLVAQARGSATVSGTPLWQLANQAGMSYKAEGPFSRLTATFRDPAMVGASFGAPAGGVTGPIASDDQRVHLLQILERIPADSTEFTKGLQMIRAQALQAARQSRVQAYLAALRASARIVDYRADIFKTDAQTAAAQTPPPGS